ncbi:YgaP-like transmembrane domain [Pseudomonas muyukensis]|uniref:DUF2892 domain-containing protein n=1 Tax=Pseudomonas muyukensis TaxID=2842357 RepID=A0ABX8M6H1_9PSED|nr:YgaP-like transmembrane domain [Pseudomonas muyukensis]QXH34583.1 DUF2892 domain-containing protein [Pseudomonas muyukensis]
MHDFHATTDAPHPNVHGLERISSLAGGALMITKGLRHGGLLGMLQVAVGGLALARGLSGHCSTKAWWQRHRAEYLRLHRDIERGAAQLKALQASAEAATGTATVTGG